MLKVNIQKEIDGFFLNKEWQVDKGEVISLFGPSGSGKSITIKSITGLVAPDDGYIMMDNIYVFYKKECIDLPSRERRIGYVPQNYALFPHMRVRENITYAMKEKDKHEKDKRAKDLLKRVGLEEKWDKYPNQLSGGEKQRIAIIRALASNPRVLLLDEPFSAVDVAVRNILRKEIKEFLTELNIPVVLVTHDPEDVRVLATKVVDYSF